MTESSWPPLCGLPYGCLARLALASSQMPVVAAPFPAASVASSLGAVVGTFTRPDLAQQRGVGFQHCGARAGLPWGMGFLPRPPPPPPLSPKDGLRTCFWGHLNQFPSRTPLRCPWRVYRKPLQAPRSQGDRPGAASHWGGPPQKPAAGGSPTPAEVAHGSTRTHAVGRTLDFIQVKTGFVRPLARQVLCQMWAARM